MDETLLPCPFCGAGEIAVGPLSRRGPDGHVVLCPGPDCQAAPEASGTTRPEAIANWNRRAPVTPGPATVELIELRDAIAFVERVKAASSDEQIAVGTDHWSRLEAAARAVGALLAPGATSWRPMASAPTDGTRIQIQTADRVVKAAWWEPEFEHSWSEEAEDIVWRAAWTDGTVASWGYQEHNEVFPVAWQPMADPSPAEVDHG